MITEKETLVQKISIFSDLSPAEIKTTVGLMKEQVLPKNTVLFKEGEPGSEMFIILQGRVAVSVRSADNAEIQLAEMSSGSFFGEMSLIENLPRSATCRLLEHSTFLSLDHTSLKSLMKKNSLVAEKILYRMLTTTTSRLHNTSALLSDMVQWGEKARLRVITDDFTGLFNRRFLDESLQNEFRKSSTAQEPLSIAMVDLDHFGTVNKTYSEAFGDTVILKASQVFKAGFRPGDILARYGGDEFTFLFPGTTGAVAQKLCAKVCEEIAALKFPEYPEFAITASMGVASFPDGAATVAALSEKADKALYAAKENGRNQTVLAKKDLRQKHAFTTIAERTRIFERILTVFREKDSFLLLGHELPDEDCISSLVAMALLISKFKKTVTIYVKDQVPDQLSYLMNICSYNKIPVIQGLAYADPKPDVVCVLDTPKPDMIAANAEITALFSDSGVLVLEFDHHLSADAAYSGSDGYCFVSRASSTCELIGFFCCKLAELPKLLEELNITELFSRNLVLSMLTGMIGDTRFGLTLKTNRDSFFYNLFSNKFAVILRDSAHENTKNYAQMTDIFKTIQSLSVEEKNLYQKLLERARYSGHTGMVILDAEESSNYVSRVDYSIFVNVIKSVTDFLTEKSGRFGLTAYYDMPEISDLIQFRVRTSRNLTGIDLRTILQDFSIEDGGGHPGAIGFRVPKNKIADLPLFVAELQEKIESL